MLERDHVADRRMADTPALLAYLPRILLYPLTGHGLGALLLLSLFLWIGMQSVFGIALLAIAAPWVFHYAEGVIDATAGGRATPPRFGGDMLFLGSNAGAFRPLVGVALIVAGWWFARAHGRGAEIAALAAGAFLFPAFMLVVAVENSLLAALNPLRLVAAMVGVGRAYGLVCAILAATAAGIVSVVGGAAQLVAIVAAIYLWLTTFHLLGYVAYHRADRLGLRVKVAAPTADSRRMDEQNERLAAVLRNVDAALDCKDLDAAARALYAEPGGPANPRLFHEELFEQLQRRRRPELIHAQGARLVTRLLHEKRAARALDVAETCYDAHPDFAPELPAQAVALADEALKSKRHGLFERLTRDAAQRYGADPATLSLLFLTARYASEHRRDDARAREILKPLLAQTSHPQHRQVAAYARALG